MTARLTGPGAPTPSPNRPPGTTPSRWWPDTSTPLGAVFYAVIGGLIVWLLVNVLPHIHVNISWH